MRDRLENFIRNNRKNFDQHEPPPALWDRIEEQLDERKRSQLKRDRIVRRNFLFRIAASLIIITGAALVFYQYQYKQATDLNAIDPQLARQQMHYTSLIEIKQHELKRIKEEEPQLYHEFSSEIRKLEESYRKLKNDLPGSPNREETVKAMIRNLQIQTEVLTRQLKIIQQIDDYKKSGSNENRDI